MSLLAVDLSEKMQQLMGWAWVGVKFVNLKFSHMDLLVCESKVFMCWSFVKKL